MMIFFNKWKVFFCNNKWISDTPLPPAAWSIFRWSTVICKISAFSSLAEPFNVWETKRSQLNINNPQKQKQDKVVHMFANKTVKYICILHMLKSYCYLFLKGAGNQPAELAETVVDPVTAPFLNYLRKDKIKSLKLFTEYVHMTTTVHIMHKVSICTNGFFYKKK